MNRAECPVAKLAFVNLVASFGGVGSATQPQPTNRALYEVTYLPPLRSVPDLRLSWPT